MFRELYELELLREDWDMLLMESEELLYSHGADAYKGISSDFKRWAKEESNIQIQAEQLCWCISFSLISVAQFMMEGFMRRCRWQ